MNEVLRCENVKKVFTVKDFFGINKRQVIAVNNVSISIDKGINTAIVGESGSGKTTLAKILLLLIKPDSGFVYYKGQIISHLSDTRLRDFRSRVRVIFQNPYKSLNPRMTVEKTIKQALSQTGHSQSNIEEILMQVGIPKEYKTRYPHQLSGGERQRIAIARALAGNPECIIADEPTGNLDATTEIYILNLLKDLQKRFGVTYVFISHNLKLVSNICDRVAVMYRGNIVEEGIIHKIIRVPLHPYTKILWNPETISIDDKPEIESNRESCVFFSRCPLKKAICAQANPQIIEQENEHFVACFLYQ
ncbi:MAG TPA: ABC transporter ATP-binding protein [bacterium]|nr:ABC transporter ATP-binding protein [bacterium]